MAAVRRAVPLKKAAARRGATAAFFGWATRELLHAPAASTVVEGANVAAAIFVVCSGMRMLCVQSSVLFCKSSSSTKNTHYSQQRYLSHTHYVQKPTAAGHYAAHCQRWQQLHRDGTSNIIEKPPPLCTPHRQSTHQHVMHAHTVVCTQHACSGEKSNDIPKTNSIKVVESP